MTHKKIAIILVFLIVGILLIVSKQKIVNFFVNKKTINQISFLQLDSDLGWKNKANFSGLWGGAY